MAVRWAGAVVLVVALVAAVVLLDPLFKRYRVPSESMEPTIEHGATGNVNRGEPPAIGDIVIFHPPAGAETGECGARPVRGQACATAAAGRSDVLFVKRIVAGPGDQVAFRSGRTIRNGKPVAESYVRACRGQACDLPRPATVPDGMYFMVGDNRGASDDSRFWAWCPVTGSSAAPSAATRCTSPARRSARGRTAALREAPRAGLCS